MFIDTTYFYAPPEAFSRGKVFLSDDEAHHLTDVLRARPGDEFLVANGIGNLFKCRLDKSHRKGVVASVVDAAEPSAQPSVHICLAMGIIRPKCLEIAVDWSVQLGIAEFLPIATDFSKTNLNIAGSEFVRLERIAVRAMKQSKRAWLITIHEPLTIAQFLKRFGKNFDGIVFADAGGVPAVPKRMLFQGSRICAVVGPEGGLSVPERNELAEYGAVPLALGSARLRTETAAVAIVAKILAWSGNI